MRYLTCLAILFLAGCAQNPIKESWLPANQDAWRNNMDTGIWLNAKDGSRKKWIPPNVLKNLLTAKEKLEAVSFVRADLAIVETDHPNAFAVNHKGRKIVAFSTSYLDALGNDLDAIATTMGHELAHLDLNHGANRQGREAGKQAVGFALGFILGPLGSVADIGNQAIFNSFTRDEEREADTRGMDWAVKAGFDPCGHARVVAVFNKMGSLQIPFLSTHPGFTERKNLANEYSLKANGKNCGGSN